MNGATCNLLTEHERCDKGTFVIRTWTTNHPTLCRKEGTVVKTAIRPFPTWRSSANPEQRAERWLKEHWTVCRMFFVALMALAALMALTIR